MSITHFELSNFTAFAQATFAFSPGINVFIGENSTGKTHVLKSLYALLKACETSQIIQPVDQGKLTNAITNKLLGVFKPDAIAHLVRQGSNLQNAQLRLGNDNKSLDVVLTVAGEITVSTTQLPVVASALYLPAQEFLSSYEGFIGAYQRRESAISPSFCIVWPH